MTEAYPLQWPIGKPRTRYPKRSRFDVSFTEARDGVLQEIRMLGGTAILISSDCTLRRDGLPYANQRQPKDCGVAVYFALKNKQMCFACDRWDKVDHNIQAVRKTIEALRGIERWGTGDMVQQAFTGFIALPSNSPWEVLGLNPGASRDEIVAAYRRKAMIVHPDAGGNSEQMARLNVAKDELLKGAA